MLELCWSLPSPPRLHYVSTCYVSGRHEGEFSEDVSTRARPSATTTRRRSSTPSCSSARRWTRACRRPSTGPGSSSGTRAPGRRRSTTAPTSSRASCSRQHRSHSSRGSGTRPRPGLPGPPRLRRRGDGRAVRARRVGRPDLRAHRPAASDRARGRRRLRPAPGQAGRLGAAVRWGWSVPCRHVPGVERLLGLPAEALDYFASPTTYSTATRARTSTAPGRVSRASRATPTAAGLHDRASRGRLQADGLTCDEATHEQGARWPGPRSRRRREPHGTTRDYDEQVTFLETPFRILRIGTNGDVRRRRTSSRRGPSQAGAIAGTGPRGACHGLVRRRPRGRRQDPAADHDVPVTDGHRAARRPAGVGDPPRPDRDAGLLQQRPDRRSRRPEPRPDHRILREFTDNIRSPIRCCWTSRAGRVHPVVGGTPNIGAVAGAPAPGTGPGRLKAPGPVSHALRARRRATPTSSSPPTTSSSPSDSRTSPARRSSPRRLPRPAGRARRRGVDMVVDTTPQPFHVTVEAAVLEAMMLATARAPGPGNDDLLETIHRRGARAAAAPPERPRRKSRFAFVIHPLSQEYFRNVEPLGRSRKVAAGFRHGRAREGDGLHAPVHLQPRHRDHVADRRGGRGLA